MPLALFLKLFGIAFVYHTIRFRDDGRFEIESKYPSRAACNFRVIQTHTACRHPFEGRIYYPFHPRWGEAVLIIRQYGYRGTNTKGLTV